MQNKKCAIIGFGYVGRAMFRLLKNHYDVCIYDSSIPSDMIGQEIGVCGYGPSTEFVRLENLNCRTKHKIDYVIRAVSKEEANTCDLGIVCVPTPMGPDGHCVVSIVEEVVKWLETPRILIKSTVKVGTTDRLKQETGKRIVFSPEYCGESSYWTPYAFHTDIKETPFFVFGGDPEDTKVMVDYMLPVTGPVKTYRQTTAKHAEMSKYVENTFFATKVAYCYEVAEICKQAGLDWNEVRELWLLDPRVNPMHTAVFEENDLCYSGKCLPKDLSGLIEFAKETGYIPSLLCEVQSSNTRIGERRASRRKK